MEEEVIVTTNTEVIEDNEEEIVVDEEIEEEEVDEEKLEIIRERDELREKNAKLYQKLKSGYKKGTEAKEAMKTGYVSKDDVKNIILETQKEMKAEADFVQRFEDANDYLPEIKKIMGEKNVGIDDAYALVKGKMMFDEGYKNQMLQSRTGNH